MAIQVTNTSSNLSGKTLVAAENADTITGVKTFSVAPVVNAGIQFPAVQVAVADVNTLDDYEEGTFTPTVVSSGGGAPTYSTQQGSYLKVGSGVWFQIRITLATIGTLAAGNITISGLPFTIGSVTGWISVSYFGALATSMSYVGGALNSGTTSISMTYIPGAGSASHSLLTQSDISGTTDIVVGGYYQI